MAKVVGVSGAQGGGKSTLLLALKDRGWEVDPFRVSRAVQEQLGWCTLDKVMDSVETMKEFQEEVLLQKLRRDESLAKKNSGAPILTERTFADVAAYTTYWCWEHVDRKNWSFGEAADWLTSYTQRCHYAQERCYDGVLVLPYMRHVVWQSDPNRAALQSSETIFQDVKSFCEQHFLSIPFRVISALGVDERADECERFLGTI